MTATAPALVVLGEPDGVVRVTVYPDGDTGATPIAIETLTHAAASRVRQIATAMTEQHCDGLPGHPCDRPVGFFETVHDGGPVRVSDDFTVTPAGTVRCEDCQDHVGDFSEAT